MIRNVTLKDAAQLATIYNYYIRTSTVTFEEAEIEADEMARRIQRIAVDADFPFLVYEVDNVLIGYAYTDTWRQRNAYRFTVESTVYLDADHFGKRIGSALYTALIAQIKEKGYHSVIGGIALPNAPSICLHEQFGFKHVGDFKEVGFKFGDWVDVGFWELILK